MMTCMFMYEHITYNQTLKRKRIDLFLNNIFL